MAWKEGGGGNSRKEPKTTCPRARKQKIMQEFDRRIRAHALGRGRERKGKACLLTLHLLELDIRTPGRGFTRGCGLTRGRDLTRSRGGARCALGKNGGFPLTILKPRAEGYETEILANLAFRGPVNRVMYAKDKLGQKIATTKGNVTAS